MFTRFTCICYLLTFVLLIACKRSETNEQTPTSLVEAHEEYSGGSNTSFDFSENAFGDEAPNLSSSQLDTFVIGNSFFRSNWITAGASAQARDGLGPILNANSCGTCHFKDGRGSPLTDKGELSALLFRLSIPGTDEHGGPLGDPNYGGQLNNLSIQNVKSEGSVKVTYDTIIGYYPDGNAYSIRSPNYEFINLQYGDLAANIQFSPRVGQQISGLGLLEAVPETTILANADENDANNDSISGKANYVWDQINQKTTLGRFGWKANQPSLRQQAAGAFIGDIGITSSINPDQNLTPQQYELYGSLPNGGSPEIVDGTFNAVVLYLHTLAVPGRRNYDNSDVLRGKQLFTQIKCDACHIAKMKTGSSTFPDLSNQNIYPYTDLLLHDMGDDLADHRPDYLADGNEWRTPPLWGIGLVQSVNKTSYFLHDGRARTLEEAILWHGGESKTSKDKFTNLSQKDRDALVKFLISL